MPKSKFLTEQDTIYSTEITKATNTLGDIKVGDNLQNKSIKEILKAIIQPYKQLEISNLQLTNSSGSNINNVILEKGGTDIFTLGEISCNITIYSDPPNSYKITQNDGTTLTTLTTVSQFSGNSILYDFKNKEINQKKSDSDEKITFTIEITDTKNKTISPRTSINYIRPYYWGTVLDTDIFDPESFATTTTSDTHNYAISSNKPTSLSFNGEGNNAYSVIMYPKSYGKLKSIKDPNGFSQEWTLLDDNGITIVKNDIDLSYYVYKSGTSTFDTITYNFAW